MNTNFTEHTNFLRDIGFGKLDDVDVTHDNYPLSVKEAKFICYFLETGNLSKSLRESGLSMRDVASKDYLADEIKYRLSELKKQTIADADEVMQYFTKVMRNEEKDQFGLDAPLSERTKAAQELAKRVVDFAQEDNSEIKVTLSWDGLNGTQKDN